MGLGHAGIAALRTFGAPLAMTGVGAFGTQLAMTDVGTFDAPLLIRDVGTFGALCGVTDESAIFRYSRENIKI